MPCLLSVTDFNCISHAILQQNILSSKNCQTLTFSVRSQSKRFEQNKSGAQKKKKKKKKKKKIYNKRTTTTMTKTERKAKSKP
jgi:hypothetical protein